MIHKGERIIPADENRAFEKFLEGLLDNRSNTQGLTPLATGTDYVPRTGPYLLHQGERVTPTAENSSRGKMVRPINITINQTIPANVDRRSRDQVAAAAGQGMRRAMARNS